jgi:transcriptional regulator with XRE-family HTH domain
MSRAETDGTAQQRRLVSTLKHLRQAAQLTHREVTEALSWSESKVYRIESGDTRISATDLRALARLYRVRDQSELGRLLALAQAAKVQPWLAYRDVYSGQTLRFLAHESHAAFIYHLASQRVPDLLQTRDYARAVIDTDIPAPTPRRRERLLEILALRQRILDASRPPMIVSFLDESILHRVGGGPDVMGEQLRHLERLAQRPNLRIQILPLGCGAYPAMGTAFTYLTFGSPEEEDLVHVDQGRSRAMTRPSSTSAGAHDRERTLYLEALRKLENLSLTAGESLAMIRARLPKNTEGSLPNPRPQKQHP